MVFHSLVLGDPCARLKMAQCVICGETVRPKQQNVLCVKCTRSTHRTCGVKLDQECYRNAQKDNSDINFLCRGCVGVNYKGEVTISISQKECPENISVSSNSGSFSLEVNGKI